MANIMSEKCLVLNVPLGVIEFGIFLYITFTSFYIQKSSHSDSIYLIFIAFPGRISAASSDHTTDSDNITNSDKAMSK
ncbi:hypothetical protein D8682_23285 [Buttiauxella sp. 3AFRM03]|nr:hypothetical protein D8682_23285 [Buttiauxella sp. 3AFRM03]